MFRNNNNITIIDASFVAHSRLHNLFNFLIWFLISIKGLPFDDERCYVSVVVVVMESIK